VRCLDVLATQQEVSASAVMALLMGKKERYTCEELESLYWRDLNAYFPAGMQCPSIQHSDSFDSASPTVDEDPSELHEADQFGCSQETVENIHDPQESVELEDGVSDCKKTAFAPED
jgi:hypothetical protein